MTNALLFIFVSTLCDTIIFALTFTDGIKLFISFEFKDPLESLTKLCAVFEIRAFQSAAANSQCLGRFSSSKCSL